MPTSSRGCGIRQPRVKALELFPFRCDGVQSSSRALRPADDDDPEDRSREIKEHSGSMGMKAMRWVGAFTLAAGLNACGGGGGSSPGRAAQPLLTLTTKAIKEDLAIGDELALKVDGRWSFAGAGTPYLQLRDSGASFSLPAIRAAGADNSIALSISPLATLAVGARTGRLELRACKDAACTQPFDTTASLPYELTVSAVPDWETHQGNARHSAEVPIRLNAAKFSKAWEWRRPADNEPIGGINPVVTRAGKVYVTTDVYLGEARLYALSETNGSEVWLQSVGNVPAFNPPAVGMDKVYAVVSGDKQTFLWAFDLETGKPQHKSEVTGPWSHFLAPTVVGDQVYQGGGLAIGEIKAYSTIDGSLRWTHVTGGPTSMFTPAVDGQWVYHYNGEALFVIDKATGNYKADIADPARSFTRYTYYGAPLLGSRGNVVVFAGGASGASAGSNAEQYQQRKMSSFLAAESRYEWSTANAYLTAPAVGGGVIYAARNDPMALDAIDEMTGKVLWTWTAPGNSDTSFHRNLVLTKTHLFVSTNSNVYAVDLKTRQAVWTYPQPGMLAISADRTLYIATGASGSDGRLVAVRLK